jgi:2-polyprenyl-6-methoxyphenol hydroxylase-like FAD-dependent oxidoreductase
MTTKAKISSNLINKSVDKPMSDTKHTMDLLIIGAGPVGLTAALEAHRLGISVRIINRKDKRSTHDSRAVVVHPRVMELLQPITMAALYKRYKIHHFIYKVQTWFRRWKVQDP